MEDTRQNVYISLTARHEEEFEEEEAQESSEGYSDLSQSPPSTGQLKNDSLHFKPFDSGEQSSHSSTLSNTVDIPSSRLLEEEESVYQPLSPFSSPFELELSLQKGPQTPVGSQPETPSPLEHSKSFPGMRPRKSSSLSNVLDDTSYSTEPPTDTISNTSNPQVHTEHLLTCSHSLIQLLTQQTRGVIKDKMESKVKVSSINRSPRSRISWTIDPAEKKQSS